MSKYEKRISGDFNKYVRELENYVISHNASAHLEATSNYSIQNVHVAIRVFERYSYTGGNRVSLNVTVVGDETSIFVCAVASGGSQALFFKVNTWGEDSFLQQVIDYTENFKR